MSRDVCEFDYMASCYRDCDPCGPVNEIDNSKEATMPEFTTIADLLASPLGQGEAVREYARLTPWTNGNVDLIGKEDADAAVLELAGMVKRLRVQHGDILRCEGCERTVDAAEAEDWRISSDGCDLCPECWGGL